MEKLFAVLTGLLFIGAFLCALLGIWIPDKRWGDTAFVFIITGIFMGCISAAILDINHG